MSERDEQNQPEPEESEETELEEEDGDVLPKREAMSIIDLGEGHGLGPPAP